MKDKLRSLQCVSGQCLPSQLITPALPLPSVTITRTVTVETCFCKAICYSVVYLYNNISTPDPQDQGVVYRLAILGAFGVLTEHCIVPQKLSTANDGDDAPIEVLHSPKMCWKLLRYHNTHTRQCLDFIMCIEISAHLWKVINFLYHWMRRIC